MDPEVMFVPVFTLVVCSIAVGIGLVLGKRRRAQKERSVRLFSAVRFF